MNFLNKTESGQGVDAMAMFTGLLSAIMSDPERLRATTQLVQNIVKPSELVENLETMQGEKNESVSIDRNSNDNIQNNVDLNGKSNMESPINANLINQQENKFASQIDNLSNISSASATKSSKKRKRKLYSLSEENEEKYLNNLQTIFESIKASSFIHEITSKLHIPDAEFEFFDDDDKEYKWKCIMQINNYTRGEGYSNKKKQAKNFAAEQLIYALINSVEYGKKVRRIINEYNVKLQDDKSDTNNSNITKNTHSLSSEKMLEKKRERNINSLNNVNNNKTTPNIKSILLPQSHSNSQPREDKIHISMDIVNKLEQKREINNIRFIYNLNDFTILNFEIFVTKWERHVLVQKEIVEVMKTFGEVKNKICRLSAGNIIVHLFGSYRNSTLRNNLLQIDMAMEYEDETSWESLVQDCFTCLNSTIESELGEVQDDDLYIQVKDLESNDYHIEANKFIFVNNEKNRISVNMFFYGKNNPLLKIQTEHKKWFDMVKNDFSVEDFILMKFLKAWRRSKNLSAFKSEIIEVLVYKSGNGSICEKILRIFHFILIDKCLEVLSPENDKFTFIPHLKEIAKYITIEDLKKIKTECSNAIELIRNGNFVEFF